MAVVAAAAHVLLHLPPLPRHGDGDDEFKYSLQLWLLRWLFTCWSPPPWPSSSPSCSPCPPPRSPGSPCCTCLPSFSLFRVIGSCSGWQMSTIYWFVCPLAHWDHFSVCLLSSNKPVSDRLQSPPCFPISSMAHQIPWDSHTCLSIQCLNFLNDRWCFNRYFWNFFNHVSLFDGSTLNAHLTLIRQSIWPQPLLSPDITCCLKRYHMLPGKKRLLTRPVCLGPTVEWWAGRWFWRDCC